jgi:2-methylcitrate dehydratase PrpD
MTDTTRALARYVLASDFDAVPEAVRHEAVRSLINWTGCAIAGAHHRTVETAMAALAPFSGPAQAQIVGRGERLDILNAALINGMASAVLDFDATQFKHTNIHPSGPVLPAVLALSELKPTPGAEALHAFLLGVEIACRLANVVFGPANPGWHVTGAVGAIGAAAAAGRLLGLDEDRMVAAFGIAATQPGGLREMYGTMCKSFTPGRASANGLMAALLAEKGFDSAARPIEGGMGLAKVLAGATELGGLTEGLGEEFEISFNIYKPFACAIVLHPIADGCIGLKQAHGIEARDIEKVALRVNPNVLVLAGKEEPVSGLEGKFSFTHATALAVVKGAAGEAEFGDDLLADPEIAALRPRVGATADNAIRKDEAHIAITLTDGRELARHVTHALGSLENPMSDADIAAKFKSLAAGVLAPRRVDSLLEMCWDAASLDDAGAIARATAPDS